MQAFSTIANSRASACQELTGGHFLLRVISCGDPYSFFSSASFPLFSYSLSFAELLSGRPAGIKELRGARLQAGDEMMMMLLAPRNNLETVEKTGKTLDRVREREFYL